MTHLLLALTICSAPEQPIAHLIVGDDTYSKAVVSTLQRDWLRTTAPLTPEQEKQCLSVRFRVSQLGFRFVFHHHSDIEGCWYRDVPQFRLGSGTYEEMPRSACLGAEAVIRYWEYQRDVLEWSKLGDVDGTTTRFWGLKPLPVARYMQFTDHLQDMEDERLDRASRYARRQFNVLHPEGVAWDSTKKEWYDKQSGAFLGKEYPAVTIDTGPAYGELPGFPRCPEEPRFDE